MSVQSLPSKTRISTITSTRPSPPPRTTKTAEQRDDDNYEQYGSERHDVPSNRGYRAKVPTGPFAQISADCHSLVYWNVGSILSPSFVPPGSTILLSANLRLS
jgi:hypothetical protein